MRKVENFDKLEECGFKFIGGTSYECTIQFGKLEDQSVLIEVSQCDLGEVRIYDYYYNELTEKHLNVVYDKLIEMALAGCFTKKEVDNPY